MSPDDIAFTIILTVVCGGIGYVLTQALVK